MSYLVLKEDLKALVAVENNPLAIFYDSQSDKCFLIRDNNYVYYVARELMFPLFNIKRERIYLPILKPPKMPDHFNASLMMILAQNYCNIRIYKIQIEKEGIHIINEYNNFNNVDKLVSNNLLKSLL